MKKPDAEYFKTRFKEYLTSHGLTYTSQRDAILEFLIKDTSHFNAEMLIYSLRQQNLTVSRATVYRTLFQLEQAGFIREIAINSDQTHYEFIDGTTHHEHLVCEKCGTIIEFSDPQLEERIETIAKERSFIMTRHTVQIFGVCGRCCEK
jgi:Fur family transcriptional regulator, ferric uptake regulator